MAINMNDWICALQLAWTKKNRSWNSRKIWASECVFEWSLILASWLGLGINLFFQILARKWEKFEKSYFLYVKTFFDSNQTFFAILIFLKWTYFAGNCYTWVDWNCKYITFSKFHRKTVQIERGTSHCRCAYTTTNHKWVDAFANGFCC